MSALDAAVTLATASGWTLSNLEIQKLLYIAQMQYMGMRGGEPMFNEDFEAWKLGPVVPFLYHTAKIYGSDPVKSFFHKAALTGIKKDVAEKVYNDLRGKKPMQLVAITHWDKGAWAKHYRSSTLGVRIPKSDIMNEYRARIAAQRRS